MLKRFFHVNICVRSLTRSILFYEKLGFEVVKDFTLDDPKAGQALGIDARKFRVVFLRLGDNEQDPVINLLEFINPPTQGVPYPSLNNVGICRVAFEVDNIDDVYGELQRMGVEFVAPLERMIGEDGAEVAYVCFKDPDGTVLEIMSGM